MVRLNRLKLAAALPVAKPVGTVVPLEEERAPDAGQPLLGPEPKLGQRRKLPVHGGGEISRQSRAERLRSDDPLPHRPGRVSPVIIERAVSPGSGPGLLLADVERLRARLDAGDRAGMYLELYRATGDESWILHAQVTSYSGVCGGAAISGNYLAKFSHPETYHVALDTFSRQIANRMLDLVEEDVRCGGRGFVDLGRLRTAGDLGVWKDKQMPEAFPGNGLFLQVQHTGLAGLPNFFTPGMAFGLEGMMRGAENGKRPSEFLKHRRYEVQDSAEGRFTTVIDRKTGKVEVFFDREALIMGTFAQIADVPLSPSDRQWHERAALWEMMHANQDRELPFNTAIMGAGKALPNPNLLTGGPDEEGIFARKIYRDPYTERWFHVGEYLAISDPAIVAACEELRRQAMAERVRLGLAPEPELPGRYLEAALF